MVNFILWNCDGRLFFGVLKFLFVRVCVCLVILFNEKVMVWEVNNDSKRVIFSYLMLIVCDFFDILLMFDKILIFIFFFKL